MSLLKYWYSNIKKQSIMNTLLSFTGLSYPCFIRQQAFFYLQSLFFWHELSNWLDLVLPIMGQFSSFLRLLTTFHFLNNMLKVLWSFYSSLHSPLVKSASSSSTTQTFWSVAFSSTNFPFLLSFPESFYPVILTPFFMKLYYRTFVGHLVVNTKTLKWFQIIDSCAD